MKKARIRGLRYISSICIFASMAFSSAMADDYIVINKNGKVFDQPKATGYVTLNQNNEEVSILPGMVFKSFESKQGWNMVEYSPGLRGYISDQVKHSKCLQPKAGTYKVANKATEMLKVENNGNVWKASTDGKTFPGKAFGNILIFFDEKGNPAYSLVDMGNVPIVMTYDNAVTKFF